MRSSKCRLGLFFVMFAFLATGCPEVEGKSGENSPPEIPWGPAPEDGAQDQAMDLTLRWKCDDPDGDTVLFDVYFGPEDPPPIVITKTLMKSMEVSGLKPGHTYYWRVTADDLMDNVVEGPLWSFTTGDEGLTLLGSIPPLRSADDVHVFQTTAYVADSEYGGLQIIDVSDPAEPVQIAEAASLGSAERVFVTLIDDVPHAFLAEGTAGLTIFDVSIQTTPYLTGNLDVQDTVQGLEVKDTTAYLAASGNMIVVDVSDPTDPVEIGRRALPSHGYAVAVAGDKAYVGTQSHGVQVLDIADPSSPVLMEGFPTEESIMGLSAAGNYLYAANHESGLLVLDISTNPPEESALLPTPSIASDVHTFGAMVMIADYDSVVVVDAETPEEPVIAGIYRGMNFVTGIHTPDPATIYAVDREAGLLILNPTY